MQDAHRCKMAGPELKFQCEMCDTRLETKVAWGAHMWKHTKDMKYIMVETAANSNSRVKAPLNLVSTGV